MPSNEARITELETRLAFQDDSLHSLNEVIASQTRDIQLLQRQIELLKQRLSEQGQQYQEITNQPPPHY